MAYLAAYKPWHLRDIKVQPAQRAQYDLMEPDVPEALQHHPCYTVMSDDGRVLGVGGYIEAWRNRGTVWSYLADHVGREFLTCHYAAQAFIDSLECKRLEMVVHVEHDEGHRWAKLLGFECEIPMMKNFLPTVNGDCAMYVRIAS
jgi:hypothetical protein